MNKIKQVNQLHEKAMELAEEAFLAKRKKNVLVAKDLYQQAYHLEQQAALLMITDYDIEPTRSVLFKSAAHLAIDIDKYQEAEQMIRLALLGNPPSPIDQELNALLLRTRQLASPMTTINKFQRLPEHLQQEVADFIDFLLIRHHPIQETLVV
ncbi:MAG: DUF2281 domain-containing protein [Bacteroidota bacterium]